LFTRQDVADHVALLHEYTAHRDAPHGGKAALFIREDGSIPTRSWFDSKFFAFLDWQFSFGDILLVLAVLHSMLVSGSRKMSSRDWAVGLLRHGRTTVGTTPPFVQSCN